VSSIIVTAVVTDVRGPLILLAIALRAPAPARLGILPGDDRRQSGKRGEEVVFPRDPTRRVLIVVTMTIIVVAVAIVHLSLLI
jgi:hypothetical protein